MNRRKWTSPRSACISTRLRREARLALLLGTAAFAGCGGGRNSSDASGGDSPSSDSIVRVGGNDDSSGQGTETGWGYPSLAADVVPAAYLQEWADADNRASCAPIAPATLGVGEGATPRAATFAGGWAVAYDMPDLRSAFGVAGTGIAESGDTYSGWTNRRDWPDGSFVEYGPEGGDGSNQLGYLRVAGEECLYNVWSRLGIEHLELLLDQLRRVTVPPV